MLNKDDLAVRTVIGPNIFFKSVGAVAELTTSVDDKTKIAKLYEQVLNELLSSLSFETINIYTKVYSAGIVVAIQTEFDLKYAGCDILDSAFDIVVNRYNGHEHTDIASVVKHLAVIIDNQKNINLRNVYKQAVEKKRNLYIHDDMGYLGSGCGTYSFNIYNTKEEDIPWHKISEIPSVLVTGTNGKTTTVRLTSFIAKNANLFVGYCSTSGVILDGEVLDEGDYSGPEGNRLVMTNPKVEIAVLEVARGGLARRGIATSFVNASVVLNVSADHLGLNGIDTVSDLAVTKFIVHDAVIPTGHHIINLDNEVYQQFVDSFSYGRAYFSQQLSETEITKFLTSSSDYACFVENGYFVVLKDKQKTSIVKVNDVELTYGGLVSHNVENVLAAICLSIELGIDFDDIRNGLLAFRSLEENQGRFNLFSIKGYKNSKLLVDYGHNVASVESMIKVAKKMALGSDARITLLLGFTGDRKFLIPDVVKNVVKHQVDYVIIKSFNSMLRGAEPYEVAKLLYNELLANGFSKDNILSSVESEIEAIQMVLSNLEENHIYVMLCQDDITSVIDTINDYNKQG